MRTWKTILALVVCLSLLVAGAALAKKSEKESKVICINSSDEKQMKVEVVEEDGKAHVKVWEIKDGEEVLVEEYEADEDDERVIKIDGEHMIMIRGDDDDTTWTTKIFDGDVMDIRDGDHDYVFYKDDKDMTWFSAGGAYLGVQLSDLDQEKAEYFEVDKGALITGVVDESPAAEAGFKIYDIITRIDDTNVEDADDAVEAVRDHEDGDEVEVTVLRKGKKKTLKATLTEQEMHAYGFGESHSPNALIKRFHGGDHDKLFNVYRHPLTPDADMDEDEVENLRADIEELRAMLEELKADKK